MCASRIWREPIGRPPTRSASAYIFRLNPPSSDLFHFQETLAVRLDVEKRLQAAMCSDVGNGPIAATTYECVFLLSQSTVLLESHSELRQDVSVSND